MSRSYGAVPKMKDLEWLNAIIALLEDVINITYISDFQVSQYRIVTLSDASEAQSRSSFKPITQNFTQKEKYIKESIKCRLFFHLIVICSFTSIAKGCSQQQCSSQIWWEVGIIFRCLLKPFLEVIGRHQIVIVLLPWVHFVPLAKYLSHTTSLLEREDILPLRHSPQWMCLFPGGGGRQTLAQVLLWWHVRFRHKKLIWATQMGLYCHQDRC